MTALLKITWWDGRTVGHVVNRGSNFFGYDPTWLATGHSLSPLKLPFTAEPFNGAKGLDELPGLLADCLPDAWGRKVAGVYFAEQKLGPLTPINLLAWRGARGLGPLHFEPVLGDAGKTKNKAIAAISAIALARGAAEIERGEPSAVLLQLVRGGTAGGAYPKALVLAYPDGTLGVGGPDGLGVPSLLKFDLSKAGGVSECEHAYSLMAAAAGIAIVSTSLVDDEPNSGRHHLLVRRFDVAQDNPKRRIHFHSLNGLLHHDPIRAIEPIDYRDLFRTALQLGVPLGDLAEITRRMVFNVLGANPDDHGKNHSFAYDERGKRWALTPAYDVTFHAGMLDRGLKVNGEIWPRIAAMESMGREVGISRDEFAGILDRVRSAIARWPQFAKEAGVPPTLATEAASWHSRIRQAVAA